MRITQLSVTKLQSSNLLFQIHTHGSSVQCSVYCDDSGKCSRVRMSENKVDCYDIVGPSILHQDAVIDLITGSILIPEEESIGYQRSVCGGMLEKSSSTLETPDIDINARFHLKSDWIQVCSTNTPFLYEIKIEREHKKKIDNLAALMQYHGVEHEVDKSNLDKSIEKSYVLSG